MKSQLEKLIDKWQIELDAGLPNAGIYKFFIDDAKKSLNLEIEEQKLHVDLVSKSVCNTTDCDYNKKNECTKFELYKDCKYKTVCWDV